MKKDSYSDYDIELEQILLDCCDSMGASDVEPLLKDCKDRVLFAKGYLHEYKFLQIFLFYLITGQRDTEQTEDIPF